MPASIDDDRQLIERYIGGDPAAILTVGGWIDLALHEGFSSLREEWDDLRQETQARVLRNLTRGLFNGRSTLRTYVHRISRNVAIDCARQAFRRREVAVDPDDLRISERGGASGDDGDLVARDLLDRILAHLSAEERTLLHFVFELHYSYHEVSRELGIPEGTVKSRMSRCKDRLSKLRRELAEQE